MLLESGVPLVEAHDVFMLDLDGVVYIGGQAVPGVPEHVAGVRASGAQVAFVTNNASRTPLDVAAHLTELGVPAAPVDVVTSAQAAAELLRERFGAGSRILAVGADGLLEALGESGLRPVRDVDDPEVVALATGYGPDVPWRDLMAAAVRLGEGLPWVATNTDLTIPTPMGKAPGHGVLVRMLQEFSGVAPVVAGKPVRPLLDATRQRTGAQRPVMVGDRLDTDMEGAYNAGMPSLLVLTGVCGLEDLTSAPPHQRPSYVSPTLEGAFEPHPVPTMDGGRAVLGGWSAHVDDAGALVVEGTGAAADWWRVAATAAWQHLDAGRPPALLHTLTPPPA